VIKIQDEELRKKKEITVVEDFLGKLVVVPNSTISLTQKSIIQELLKICTLSSDFRNLSKLVNVIGAYVKTESIKIQISYFNKVIAILEGTKLKIAHCENLGEKHDLSNLKCNGLDIGHEVSYKEYYDYLVTLKIRCITVLERNYGYYFNVCIKTLDKLGFNETIEFSEMNDSELDKMIAEEKNVS